MKKCIFSVRKTTCVLLRYCCCFLMVFVAVKFFESQVTPNFFSFFFFNKQQKVIRYRAWQTERNKLFRRFGYSENLIFCSSVLG